MSERAQLKHLLLDCSFPNKDKTVELAAEHGGLGCWYFICLLCAMSEATNGEISRAKALQVARAQNVEEEEAIKIIGFLLAREMIQEHGEKLTNSRVIEDQEACHRKLSLQRQKQKRYRKKTATLPSRKGNGHGDPVSVHVTDNDLDLDLKNKLSHLSPELQAEVPLWISHRADKGKPMGFSEVDALIMDCGRDPEGQLRAMRHHRKNGNKNLYPVAEEEPRAGPRRGGKSVTSAYDEKIRILQES